MSDQPQEHDNITEHQPRKHSILGSYPADHHKVPAPESLSHGKLDNIIGTLHKDQESPFHRKASADHTAKDEYYGGHPPEHEFREDETKEHASLKDLLHHKKKEGDEKK